MKGYYVIFDKKGELVAGRKSRAEAEEVARKWIEDHNDACYQELTVHSVGEPVSRVTRSRPLVTVLK